MQFVTYTRQIDVNSCKNSRKCFKIQTCQLSWVAVVWLCLLNLWKLWNNLEECCFWWDGNHPEWTCLCWRCTDSCQKSWHIDMQAGTNDIYCLIIIYTILVPRTLKSLAKFKKQRKNSELFSNFKNHTNFSTGLSCCVVISMINYISAIQKPCLTNYHAAVFFSTILAISYVIKLD